MKPTSVLVAAVCGLACCVAADTVTFKSGAKLIGTLTDASGDKITFKSDDVGEVKIDAAKVASLVTEKKNVVQFKDETRREVVLGIVTNGWTADGRSLDMAQVKAVNPKPEQWHGSINVSASAARGNTVSENAAVIVNVNRRFEKDRVTFDGAYHFAQSGSSKDNKQKTDDKITLAAQEDHFWSKRFYNYVNGKYERDGIQNLDFRYRIGLGLGLQWLDGDETFAGKFSFSQEAGAEYSKERYDTTSSGGDDNYPSFRYAHHLKWTPIWVPSIAAFHNFEYHPDMSDWAEQYVINADVGFSTVIYAGWDLLAKIEWDYDSEPADTAKNSDIRYILGLGYKW